MDHPDDLFTLRNYFYVGLYQEAIAEGSGLGGIPEHAAIEKDELIYRSYIAMGQASKVTEAVKDDAPASLQAVKLLAVYTAQPENRDMVMLTMGDYLSDPVSANNTTLQLIAAIIYCLEDNVKEAIKLIHNGVTMEQISFLAQIYLRMDRVDLALAQLQILQQADDDATLTQLVGAWVHMAKGGKKVREAAYIYDELIDKYAASPMLLNGMAVARMHLGEWGDAEAALQEAFTKAPTDADTLINLIACCQHTNKPDATIERHIAQLKASHPAHPYIADVTNVESAFSRVAAQFAA
ncbi:unnamed protein product [Chrysoparadoxa australica]